MYELLDSIEDEKKKIFSLCGEMSHDVMTHAKHQKYKLIDQKDIKKRFPNSIKI